MRGMDLSAVSLSGVCLAHCLALPLFASLSPLIATFAASELAHALFVAAAVPISAAALGPGILRRRFSPVIVAAATLAILLLIAGVAGWSDETWETPLTVGGASLLAGAHLLNWHTHRRCTGRTAVTVRHGTDS
jgi:hypothetical protein